MPRGAGLQAEAAAHPKEWVPQNKTQKQQEEGKADKNAQSSCGNVGNAVTPQLADTYCEA